MITVKISYFYQVRFFESWQLPLSTAVWDPKWYHDNRSQDHIFLDKRGVVNGLRLNPLVPPASTSGMCYGRKNCDKQPSVCDFIRTYSNHLHSMDFDVFIKNLTLNAWKVCTMYNIPYRPEAILLVHESPDNQCSERIPLINWFSENGYTLREFVKEDVPVV